MHSVKPQAGRHGASLPRLLFASLPLICLVAAGVTAAIAREKAEERVAVQQVVDDLFSAMRQKDRAALERLFLPEARLGHTPVTSWIDTVSAGSAQLDEITYNETILIDDDLAMAWTPYTLYVDGSLHHCGVDVFVLRRIEGVWKILQLDDTRRPDDCPDPRT